MKPRMLLQQFFFSRGLIFLQFTYGSQNFSIARCAWQPPRDVCPLHRFSVWLLLVFYLLFYSSYGPVLWRLLAGPLGPLLALPAAFATLFWLVRYLLLDDEESSEAE